MMQRPGPAVAAQDAATQLPAGAMSALEPTTKSDKAKQETKYVQLGESERRRLAAPATVEATKRRAKASVIVSEMSVQLERFVDIDPRPTGDGNEPKSTCLEYEVILEVARGLQQIVRTTGSSALAYDHLDEVVSNCDLMLQQTPSVALAEQIRRLLVIIARPMSFLSEDAEDLEEPVTGTGYTTVKRDHDHTHTWYAPKVITALTRAYFGEADFMPEIPLWFAGDHTAKECEKMLFDKTNGTFLIRDSETKADTLNLTLRHTDLIFHFRINRNVDGDYFITETDHFPTLWELVRCHSTVQSIGGYTIELLYPVFSYASNPWYHGSISKLDSESLLIDSESGCYLVRRSASEAGGYTLTLRMASSIHHYRIIADGRRFGLNKDVMFKSLEKLVKFYAKKEQGMAGTPRLNRSLHRDASHGIDLTDGQSYYVNMNPNAQPVQAKPCPVIGSGFGKSGLYQRRYMKTLELKSPSRQTSEEEGCRGKEEFLGNVNPALALGPGRSTPSAASKEAACREQLAMVRDTLASMRPGSGAQSEGVERERLHFTIAQLVQDLEYLVAARDPAVGQ